jgi:probable HAF family extracellular repeat protein
MSRFSFAACLAVLPFCAVAAPPQYAVVDLGIQEIGAGLLWPPSGLLIQCTAPPSNYPTLGGAGSCIYASNSVAYVGISARPDGGSHAARWIYSNGSVTVTDLGILPNANEIGTAPVSIAFSLNRVGDVVGESDTQYPQTVSYGFEYAVHAFVWNNGVMTDLGTIAGNDYSSSAEGVNDSHEIVGWTNTVSSVNGEVLRRAFLYTGGTMYNLTFYLVGGPTVLLAEATGIDCQGNISANGTPASGGGSLLHNYLLVRQGAPRTNCPQ